METSRGETKQKNRGAHPGAARQLGFPLDMLCLVTPLELRLMAGPDANCYGNYLLVSPRAAMASIPRSGRVELPLAESSPALGTHLCPSTVAFVMHTEFIHSNRLAGELRPISGLVRETDGSTGVEYAIVLALISVGMLVSVQAVGTGAKSLLQSVSSSLEAFNSGSGAAASLGKTTEEAPGMFN